MVAATSTEPDELRRFHYTSLGQNSNKFYTYKIWHLPGGMLRVVTENGREGAAPQVREYTWSRSMLEDKIYERIHRKGYSEVDLASPAIVVEPDDADPAQPAQAQQDPRVVRLFSWIFQEAGERISQYLSTRVEKLSENQIAEGRRLLTEAQRKLSAILNNSVANLSTSNLYQFDTLVEQYYRAVPTILPARIQPLSVVGDFLRELDEQEDRLQQLAAAIATLTVTRKGGSQAQAIGADIKALEPTDAAYLSIVKYVADSATAHHGFRINPTGVYEVCIPKEREAYTKNPRGKANVKLVFHGSFNSNFRHILKTGLIIPRTASHGRMFGAGVYFADRSTKSGQYCSGSHGVPNMMLLCEASLGKMYEAPTDMPYATEPPAGHDSVWGREGRTKSWSSTLLNNEFITYSPTQQTIRYMITFDKR